MSNSVRPYLCKGVLNEGQVLIKDIDTTQGRILGYFAIFGNVDSDGDMIMPGAFKRTLKENYKRIKHLAQHNPWQPLSSTKSGLVVREDSKGLLFDSPISQTSWGKDYLQLYVDGVIDEQSIGYEVINDQKKNGYKELTELKLWEGSAVTWGANEQAMTTGIKSMSRERAIERLEVGRKAFRNGSYEHEEIFDLLDIYTKQIETHIITLSEKSIPPAEEASDPQDDDNSLLLLRLHAKKHLLTF